MRVKHLLLVSIALCNINAAVVTSQVDTPNQHQPQITNSIPTSINGFLGGGSLGEIFSMPSLSLPSVRCDNVLNLDFLSRIKGACSAINSMKGNFSLNVGPCAVNGSVGDCAKQKLSDYCNNLTNSLIRDGGKVLMSPISAAGISTKETIISGGDIVMTAKTEPCNAKVKNSYNSIRYGNSTTESNVYEMTTMKNMQGTSAFSRDVELTRDCIRAGASAGMASSAIKQKCSTGAGMTLPSNQSEVNKIITETATQHLLSPDKSLASSMAATESAIATKLANCSNSSDYESCKKTQLSASAATDTIRMGDSIVVATELTNARKLKIAEDATRGKRLIVHFDDESMQNLPIQSRAAYASASRRQIAFMTSYRYITNESSSLSKEIDRIALKKIEESAKPFFENQALQRISQAIK